MVDNNGHSCHGCFNQHTEVCQLEPKGGSQFWTAWTQARLVGFPLNIVLTQFSSAACQQQSRHPGCTVSSTSPSGGLHVVADCGHTDQKPVFRMRAANYRMLPVLFHERSQHSDQCIEG